MRNCSVLVSNQYGFRAGCSTSHAILDIVTSTYDNIDNNQYTEMVTLDITKAFDPVCHKRLLIKLDHYGIRVTVFKLIQSYLNNRLQYVFINNIESNRKSVVRGVPQGSVLGLLLFLIFINDQQNCLKSIPRLFADDTALLINASSINELEIKINQELSRVFQWMNKNCFTINPAESQAIIIPPLLSQVVSPNNINIKLNSSTIPISDTINYLGVLIDSKLLFCDHIHKICNKLSRAVGILCKLKNLFPSCILKKLYFTFFHSHLLYCLIIWSATYKTYLEPLKKLQNKALRVINNMQWSSNSDPLFKKNKILKLEDLIKLETSKLMFNLDRCKLPNSFTKYFKSVSQIHFRVTRLSDNNMLYLPRY